MKFENYKIGQRVGDRLSRNYVRNIPSRYFESTESVQVMLDKSLSEENKAVADYLERAAKCKELGNIKAAKLFEELARDESVHVAQLTEAKELFGYTDAEVEQEGSKEAQELLNKPVKENIKMTNAFDEQISSKYIEDDEKALTFEDKDEDLNLLEDDPLDAVEDY